MPHADIKPTIDRFAYTSSRVSGNLYKDATGDLIRLADVQGLLTAARRLELYGATVPRLQTLGRELRRIGL
jgi:hypothetical protein